MVMDTLRLPAPDTPEVSPLPHLTLKYPESIGNMPVLLRHGTLRLAFGSGSTLQTVDITQLPDGTLGFAIKPTLDSPPSLNISQHPAAASIALFYDQQDHVIKVLRPPKGTSTLPLELCYERTNPPTPAHVLLTQTARPGGAYQVQIIGMNKKFLVRRATINGRPEGIKEEKPVFPDMTVEFIPNERPDPTHAVTHPTPPQVARFEARQAATTEKQTHEEPADRIIEGSVWSMVNTCSRGLIPRSNIAVTGNDRTGFQVNIADVPPRVARDMFGVAHTRRKQSGFARGIIRGVTQINYSVDHGSSRSTTIIPSVFRESSRKISMNASTGTIRGSTFIQNGDSGTLQDASCSFTILPNGKGSYTLEFSSPKAEDLTMIFNLGLRALQEEKRTVR